MTLLSLGIGLGLAVFILTKIISSVITWRRCQAEAARQGCEPAPAISDVWSVGLALILGHLKAGYEERGPPYMVKTMNKLGPSGEVHTARVKGESHSFGRACKVSLILTAIVLGSEILATRDPENVRAIFATQASSFEINSSRYVVRAFVSARHLSDPLGRSLFLYTPMVAMILLDLL